MGSVYEDYKTDTDLEQEGTVREYGSFWIKLARAGGSNKAYSKTLQRKTSKYRRAIEIGKLPDEIVNTLVIETFAETVVLDWGGPGMIDPDTKAPIPCNREEVIKLFTNLPDLFAQVHKDAQDAETFKRDARAADSGE